MRCGLVVDHYDGSAVVDRRYPSVGVHVIVIGAGVDGGVGDAGEGVVARYRPYDVGHEDIATEAQETCGIVHVAHAVEPYALKVQGHEDFLAGVGVVAVDPDLVVAAVETLGPHVVDKDISFQLVGIAAVDHQLRLVIEIVHHAVGLGVGEIVHRAGRGHTGEQCKS